MLHSVFVIIFVLQTLSLFIVIYMQKLINFDQELLLLLLLEYKVILLEAFKTSHQSHLVSKANIDKFVKQI